MKRKCFLRLMACFLATILCLPGCNGTPESVVDEEPENAMSAWRMADIYGQLLQSTQTEVKLEEGDESRWQEFLGLGIEGVSLGLEIYNSFKDSDEFKEINRKLDEINHKLDVVNHKLDRIQQLLVDGLKSLSQQLEVDFADLKSFIANTAIQEQISVIKTYTFTSGPSGLYWLTTKNRVKNTAYSVLKGNIAEWQSALKPSGPNNIELVLQKINDYILPDLYKTGDEGSKGALDVYADYLIASLRQAQTKGTLSHNAFVAAYLSYERFYSTLLYWEHTGALLHTELYNSLKMKDAAKNYLEGTFAPNIKKQNQRFLENGTRLLSAFYGDSKVARFSMLPDPTGGKRPADENRIFFLREQRDLAARLGFFVASYEQYAILRKERQVGGENPMLTRICVLAYPENLLNATPWFGWKDDDGKVIIQENDGRLMTVATPNWPFGGTYNMYIFPSSSEKQITYMSHRHQSRGCPLIKGDDYEYMRKYDSGMLKLDTDAIENREYEYDCSMDYTSSAIYHDRHAISYRFGVYLIYK